MDGHLMLVGYDLDGVLTAGVQPEGETWIVISGRTWAEYDGFAKNLAAQVPVYIRGVGRYGDRLAAGKFKAAMIAKLGVEEYHEDDSYQAQIIQNNCPGCKVVVE